MPAVSHTLLDVLSLRTAHQVRRVYTQRVVAQMHDDGLRCDPLAFVKRLHGHAVRADFADLALART